MKVKKLAALTLLLVLGVFSASCRPQKPAPTIQINEKPVETVTLKMFFPMGIGLNSTDGFRDLTLAYNAMHGNVKISVDSVSTADGFDDFLIERLGTDDAVDVFIVNAESVKDIARAGRFYDLSDLDSVHALAASAKEQAVISGTTYCVPLKMAAYVMDVNVSLLERHGLKVPENYDEFLHCCEVLKAAGVTPIAVSRWWAMAVPVMARSLYPIYQAENREELIQGLNSGRLKIGDYMIHGFEMLEDFLEKGYYGQGLTMDQVDAIKANTQDLEDFRSGKVAFRFYAMKELRATEIENGDTSISAAIPVLPHGAITLPSISDRLCVNANSRHLEQAVDFVAYLVSQRAGLLAQDTSGSLSPFHSSAAPQPKEAWQQEILEIMEAGRQIPLEDMNLHFGCWDNTRKLCLAMVGGMSAEQAAQEYNRIQAEELEAYAETDK